jgi:hypothetical protein
MQNVFILLVINLSVIMKFLCLIVTSFYLLIFGVEGWLMLHWITLSDAYTHTYTHSVGLLWTSDRPVAETSTWQHTTFTTERDQCRRRDSNLQCQQVSSRKITLLTARPPGSALYEIRLIQIQCSSIELHGQYHVWSRYYPATKCVIFCSYFLLQVLKSIC